MITLDTPQTVMTTRAPAVQKTQPGSIMKLLGSPDIYCEPGPRVETME